MMSRTYGARSPRSHYDVILIVTSFAAELAMPTVADICMDTLPHLVYEDEWRYLGATDHWKSCDFRAVPDRDFRKVRKTHWQLSWVDYTVWVSTQ